MKKIFIILFLFLVGIFIWLMFFKPKLLQVVFFDVGQGDACLITTPSGQTILIDGGPGRSLLTKLGQQMPWHKRTIDVVILTHPHADHLAGLLEVLKRYKVRLVLWTGVLHTSPEYLTWLKIIKEKNISARTIEAGQKIILESVILETIWPEGSLAGQTVVDLNASSLVIRLVYLKTALLLTGDINQTEEELILAAGRLIEAQIIKIAHQGSSTSSSLEFLRAVKPVWAVISVGDNNYGHPHKIIMDRLKKLFIKILRTDKLGDIEFRSDGKIWQPL
ncbi:MBL fold metallo-hydrolase [Patescibacteria group bacterium]|nr:MBL fold metallo-hydrolase [Patescibacteria group bacterium]